MLEAIADRKKSLATTVRVDIRSLATYYKYCASKGVQAESYAGLLTIITETMVRAIGISNPEFIVHTAQEAVDYFKLTSLGNPLHRKKNRKSLYDQLADEAKDSLGVLAEDQKGIDLNQSEKDALLKLAAERNKEQASLKEQMKGPIDE